MPACPSSTQAGCRCGEHHPGLLAYTVNDEHHASLIATLAKLQDRTPVLAAVPSEPVHDPRSYTCECPQCRADVAARVVQASRRAA